MLLSDSDNPCTIGQKRKIFSRPVVLTVAYFSLLAIVSGCARSGAKIPYPEPPPADSILSFLPGIVCSGKDSIDFNAAFSPDGRSFYFTRSQNRKWDIYVSNYDGTSWLKAKKAAFNSDLYSEADPAFAPDGSLYYISDSPKDEADTLGDFDIWSVNQLPDGNWTQPQNIQRLIPIAPSITSLSPVMVTYTLLHPGQEDMAVKIFMLASL